MLVSRLQKSPKESLQEMLAIRIAVVVITIQLRTFVWSQIATREVDAGKMNFETTSAYRYDV